MIAAFVKATVTPRYDAVFDERRYERLADTLS